MRNAALNSLNRYRSQASRICSSGLAIVPLCPHASPEQQNSSKPEQPDAREVWKEMQDQSQMRLHQRGLQSY